MPKCIAMTVLHQSAEFPGGRATEPWPHTGGNTMLIEGMLNVCILYEQVEREKPDGHACRANGCEGLGNRPKALRGAIEHRRLQQETTRGSLK